LLEKEAERSLLSVLVEDYVTQKQTSLLKIKKGAMTKETFLEEVRGHIAYYYELPKEQEEALLSDFEQYVFGYSVLSPLIDDDSITDIRVVSHDRVRIKRNGIRMDAGVFFQDANAYKQFVDYVATRNQVSISNLNAIQRFVDHESHPKFILRFTVSMPLVNTASEPYLCIRKVKSILEYLYLCLYFVLVISIINRCLNKVIKINA